MIVASVCVPRGSIGPRASSSRRSRQRPCTATLAIVCSLNSLNSSSLSTLLTTPSTDHGKIRSPAVYVGLPGATNRVASAPATRCSSSSTSCTVRTRQSDPAVPPSRAARVLDVVVREVALDHHDVALRWDRVRKRIRRALRLDHEARHRNLRIRLLGPLGRGRDRAAPGRHVRIRRRHRVARGRGGRRHLRGLAARTVEVPAQLLVHRPRAERHPFSRRARALPPYHPRAGRLLSRRIAACQFFLYRRRRHHAAPRALGTILVQHPPRPPTALGVRRARIALREVDVPLW